MSAGPDFQQCLAFINCQVRPAGSPVLGSSHGAHFRAVTISRQAGSGGHAVAEKLTAFLQSHSPNRGRPWTLFDRNLVEQVLEDHHLPARLARFMPENRSSEIQDALDELLGVHPPVETLVRKTAETILRLTELGNVIFLGRGANVITAKRDNVFHVRLVGSLARRVEFVQRSRQLAGPAALKVARDEDRGRRAYLKRYYHADIDDPLLYHLVLNTDFICHEGAARLIGGGCAVRVIR